MNATFTIRECSRSLQICKVLPNGRNYWMLEEFATVQSAVSFLKEQYEDPTIYLRLECNDNWMVQYKA